MLDSAYAKIAGMESIVVRARQILQQSGRRLAFATVLFAVPLAIFVKLAEEVREREMIGFDSWLLLALRSQATTSWTMAMTAISFLGSTLMVTLVTIVIIGWLAAKRRVREALTVAFMIGGAAVINTLLKLSFQRQRPTILQALVSEQSFSFPSGHAMASAALACVVVYLAWQSKYRWLAVVLGVIYVGAVGLSRVYLGVHYPSDVVAGWCVSIIWSYVVIVSFRAQARSKN